MFKNKTICVPLNTVSAFVDNYKEYVEVFYEVSDFCLENHILC
uniref:Uncharacterized protein n=1 Tax=viral metagenome TaxID=1070528 RepID=A0A6C0LKN7_9ZZZZ